MMNVRPYLNKFSLWLHVEHFEARMWFYAVELQTSVSSDTVFFSLKAVQEIYRSMEVIQELIANSNLDLAKAMFAPKTVIKSSVTGKKC